MSKLISFLLFSVLFFTNLPGQSSMVFHYNQPYYFPGETVHFSIHNAKFRDNNITFLNQIIDSNGKVNDHFYSPVNDNGIVEGFINIPFSWTSGVYRHAIIVFDEDQKKDIYVCHATIKVLDSKNNRQPELNKSDISTTSFDNTIITNKTVYRNRELVKISPYKNQNYSSISVIDVDMLDGYAAESIQELQTDIDWDNTYSSKPFITGKIFDGSGTSPLSVKVLGIFDIDHNKMYYSKSDKDGNFHLQLDDFEGQRRLQFLPYLFREYDDIVVRLNTALPPKNYNYTSHTDSLLINNLIWFEQRNKIYQSYRTTENRNQEVVESPAKFKLKPNLTYHPEDFVAFQNIGSFFEELLSSPMSFNKDNNDQWKASVLRKVRSNIYFDRKSQYYEFDPIFIVDGRITKDANLVGNMTFNSVKSVGVYNDIDAMKRDFGTFNGSPFVVVETTYPEVKLPENFESDILNIKGYQGHLAPAPVENSSLSQLPRFHQNTYWNPSVSTNEIIQFETTDDKSEYIIIAVSVSDEGHLLVKSGTINVE